MTDARVNRVLVIDFTKRRIYWSEVKKIQTLHPTFNRSSSGTTFDVTGPRND